MPVILAISLGAIMGALARYGLSSLVTKIMGTGFHFPLGTFLVNIVGCFLMGVVIMVMDTKFSTHYVTKQFLTVGILGSFTTFSTFSLDFITLLQKGSVVSACIYFALSSILSICGLYAGMILVKQLL